MINRKGKGKEWNERKDDHGGKGKEGTRKDRKMINRKGQERKG